MKKPITHVKENPFKDYRVEYVKEGDRITVAHAYYNKKNNIYGKLY